MTIDDDTKNWIRNAADERAAKAGMVFDGERAEFACDWIEAHCCLYQDDDAGEPMRLLPYQRDYASRLFGWIRPSREWGCWIRRFTHAALWAAKKNGKSPFCAAINLLLLIADGVQGNHIYMGAANGQQAAIAQEHAIEMVRYSPALSDECRIHSSTLKIRHLPTKSTLSILTGRDKQAFKAKDGLNGSVSFDEMHVVDRKLVQITRRAGRSRKEPLNLSYSTAGDDLDSVGYERYRYGCQVNSGERDDPHFLHVDHSAPRCSEAEIESRLEELLKAANPAWGTIIKPSVLIADWHTSKSSTRTLVEFLQFSLNWWVGSSTRWLDQGGWAKGQRKYSIGDLAGRECYAALDLSRTRDMSSMTFAFPWIEDGPEAVRLWPMFWIPEERAKELQHRYPLLDWAAKGHLKLIRGATVDYNQIKDDIRKVINDNHLFVLSLHYDKTYANEITQALHEGETIDGHSIPGVVAARIDLPQQMLQLSPPSKEFERRVIDGSIQHPGNDVLTWQVAHCEVITDVNQNCRPVKPDKDSGKTIDGVITSVMTMAGFGAAKGEWPEAYFERILFEDWPQGSGLVMTVAALDANKAREDLPSDYQSHTVVSLDRKGGFWVECECARDAVPQMVSRCTKLARDRNAKLIALEAGPNANICQPEFQKLSDRGEVPANVNVQSIPQPDPRVERIRRLEHYLAHGQIHVRNTLGGRLLVDQLRAFPKGHYTAAARALELALKVIELSV